MIEEWAKLPQGMAFGTPSAVATDSQDKVYLFQRGEPPVLIFDPDGNYLSSWGNGAFARPHGFYIVDDIAYVTDSDDSVVMKFTLDGRLLQLIGERGVHSDTGSNTYGDLVPRAAGPFNHPTEMVPSASGELYVSDGEINARVTSSPAMAVSYPLGGSQVRLARVSSTCPTASSWTGMSVSMYAIGRIAVSRSSQATDSRLRVGPIYVHPPTSLLMEPST